MKKFVYLFLMLLSLLGSAAVTAETLNVGTIERPPMAMKNAYGRWSGFSVDLLRAISLNANFNYIYTEYDNFAAMLTATEQAEVDLSIANITITYAREQTMDFSYPIIDSGLQVVISKDRQQSSIFNIILDSGVLWFVFGAFFLLLIIAHVVWFFERGTASGRHDYFRDDYIGGVWDAFWWAFIIMTMGGFENEVPATKLSRLLAMMWIIVSLFFISTITAKITSSMTVSGLNSDIGSFKDLDGKKVGVVKSKPIIDYTKRAIGVSPVVFSSYEQLYAALKDKQLDAIIGDAPILNYHVSHAGQNDFEAVGGVFKPEKYGIAYPQGSALKERIDLVILKLQESGEYQAIYDKYFL